VEEEDEEEELSVRQVAIVQNRMHLGSENSLGPTTCALLLAGTGLG
jgi:hypothetical protein